MNWQTIAFGCCAGIAATLTMDVSASVARKIGLIVGAQGNWVGRWYLGIVRGRFVHSDITCSPELPGEKRAALIGHYVIGSVLAVFYLAGATYLELSPASFLPAVGYGLATSVFPWFLVFPALGFGVVGRRAPPELKLFRSSLVNHLSYGFGLWWIANLLPIGW